MISKSSFIRGYQCLKSLYLHKKRPFLRDPLPPETIAKFKRGHEVGIIAQSLFPGGTVIASSGRGANKKYADIVRKHISEKTKVMYEVPFMTNDLMAIMDIVTYDREQLHAYEVKSSLSISDIYLWDITFQSYVIQQFGVSDIDYHIVHLNPDYIRQQDIDLQKLFRIVNVDDEIRKRSEILHPLIEQVLKTETLNKSPEIPIGSHCFNPYRCDFIGHCWKHIPKPSIFDIQDLPDELKFWLYSEGKSDLVSSLPFIQDENLKNKVISVLQQNPIIQKDKILNYIHHDGREPVIVKLISHHPAIPQHINTSPFQTVPILLMIMHTDNDDETTYHYLNNEQDNTLKLKEVFDHLQNLSKTNKIICFGDSEQFIKVSTWIDSISDFSTTNLQFVDLQMIFRQNWYIAPEIHQQPKLSSVIKHFHHIPNINIEKNLRITDQLEESPQTFFKSEPPQMTLEEACHIWGQLVSELYQLLQEKMK